MTYQATDEDLPEIFAAAPPPNPVIQAKLRIHQQATAMGIPLSLEELTRFAVVLVAMEQD